MTLAASAVEEMISQFGETITIYNSDGLSPKDNEDPIFFGDEVVSEEGEEHDVRLYHAPSEEIMQEYGLSEDTDALFYTNERIAEEGDRVEYDPLGSEWVIESITSNQIGNGPYLFLYSMRGV